MKILQQLLKEAGADMAGAVTIVPLYGGYFSAVKRVEEYSSQKIVLSAYKRRVTIIGENLTIDKYFMQDLSVKGNITGVTFE
ncbi:MAG: YabP/YqfC family sporulation protein [Candidatus Coproplasma sp.]